MGKAMGQAEPPPWHSQPAAGTGTPEQRRRGLLDAPLRERAACCRHHLLARSWCWCWFVVGVAISVSVGFLPSPAARAWWWWCVAMSVAAVGLLPPPAARTWWWWWCVAISVASFLAPPAARPRWWCGVAISLAAGLLAPPEARPWWWCGVSAFFLTISARWSMDKGKPVPMASPDSRNDLAEIPTQETDWPEALSTDCYSTALFCSSKVVKEADPETNTAISLCLSVSSRIVWFLLNSSAGIFKGKSIMPVPKCARLPEVFGFHLDAMVELVSDHQLPRSPLIANISEDSPQEVDAVSNSNTEIHQDGDACRIRSQNVPVFIRHCSGLVLLTLNLDKSSEHMMSLYEQKTKTKIANRYFLYGLKRIEPEHTLRSYGIARNTTVHLCGRLLGGKTDTLEKYVSDNRENFSVEVPLPDGNVSLDMTKIGCLILLTLLKCFTHAFSSFKSWNGDITMSDFKVTDGHVRVIKSAEENLNSSSLQADLKILVYFIRKIFYKGNPKLIAKYPPYLNSLISFLLSLRTPCLDDDDKLFIETHMSCVESFARGMLLIKLRKKYKSLPPSKKKIWNAAIKDLDKVPRPYTSVNQVSEVAVFHDIIEFAKNENKAYTSTRHSTIRLVRDEFAHAPSHRFDKSVKPWKEKFKNDNGIELMIPAKFNDMLPATIRCLIKAEGIDIKKELLAAQVRCTCPLCHPWYLELKKIPSKKDKAKDRGESSKHGGEMSKHGEGSSKGVAQTALPSQKATSSMGLSKASQEATCSSEGSQAKKLIKNATAKASPQKMQPSTPGPSRVKPKLQSTDGDGFIKKKGKNKCPRARAAYPVSMLWFSIAIFLVLFCVIVAAVFLL
ncbi:unnamed protein product [Urochloa humidicola]